LSQDKVLEIQPVHLAKVRGQRIGDTRGIFAAKEASARSITTGRYLGLRRFATEGPKLRHTRFPFIGGLNMQTCIPICAYTIPPVKQAVALRLGYARRLRSSIRALSQLRCVPLGAVPCQCVGPSVWHTFRPAQHIGDCLAHIEIRCCPRLTDEFARWPLSG